MEVADQWRREWAGTAEYGKVLELNASALCHFDQAVIAKMLKLFYPFMELKPREVVEGGVTRRIARAMEVLHASGPGARVKVMRAAYHTTAGPGTPASSYMVHASRRVYSSGFNSGFLEPPSLPTEPLEISSTPLALLQDPHTDTDTENYKVTEPDDFDISEPSKWRSSTGGSIRMPSEESSSTDNASIIDVSRNHKNVFRKYSCDSENSDIPLNGKSSRLSPLLDSPTLSTLKYKSLLNGNNDWNSRRKSYSFEDTSPLSETIQLSNDTLAMESSTDSGICKSTEIVNDQADEKPHIRYFGSKERNNAQDNSYESWLSKNKQNSYKGTRFKGYRDRDIVDDPKENITLQPTGKVTITLPVTLETDQEYEIRKNYEEHQRKIKKVEFCKTELHFAAETGKVNIIATDEKPPPTNDFRKRRSAFVPMRDVPEKPIMLFGENNDFSNETNSLDLTISEKNEIDENTAGTKSILKNKIPKPKPYLLGENMAFGTDESKGNEDGMSRVTTGVSLINKQLQAQHQRDILASFSQKNTVSTNAFRTANLGPQEVVPSNKEVYDLESDKTQKIVRIHDERSKFNAKRTSAIVRSPTPARSKARELRESDLTYFGVNNAPKNTDNNKQTQSRREIHEDSLQHLFQSVKLIQQVSNSVCNSESEDAPEYQNINFNRNYVPKPTPRIRSKYDDKPNHIEEIVLNPIIEQATIPHDETVTRRSKSRKQEDFNSMKNRSRSEPRRAYAFNSIEKPQRQLDQQLRSNGDQSSTINKKLHLSTAKTPSYKPGEIPSDTNPIYINLKTPMPDTKESNSRTRNSSLKVPKSNNGSVIKPHRKIDATKSNTNQDTEKAITKKHLINENKNTAYLETKCQKRNSENQLADKGDYRKSGSSRQNTHPKTRIEHSVDTGTNKSTESKASYIKHNSTSDMKERTSRSSHRHSKTAFEDFSTLHGTKDSSDKKSGSDVKDHKRLASKDKSNTRNEPIVIPKVGTNSSRTSYSKDSSRHGSRQGRREIVINYDDKNGTVSSVSKTRSGSGSPRRKKTSKDMVKETYKESMKSKSSDKALLQFEDHQRNSNTVNGYRKKHNDRSCQVL